MNLAEKLLTAVGIMTDAAVQKAGYDRTVVATIATVDDLETKTYTVQYGDAKHTAKGNAEYKIGDQVYVIIPGEDTLDWQISSLAQGIMSGGSWIDVKDLPPDNLFIDASKGASLFSTNQKQVALSGSRYNIWKTQLINEILKGRVYTQIDIESNNKIEDADLDYNVELKVYYQDANLVRHYIRKYFSINDMIGDPRGGEKVSQFGVFSFSQEEVTALNAAKSSIGIEVKLYRSNTNLQMSNLHLFGYQPDEVVLTDIYQVKVIAQNYPIEVDSTQTSIALDIGLYGGNVRIPYSTSMEVYMAKKYFSWDTLTWNITPYSKINLDTNSMYTITTTTALYKESTFYFKIKYAGKWYAADGVTIHNLTKDTEYFLVESTLNEKYKIKISYNDNNDATGRWKIVGANGSFISTDGTTWSAIAEEQIIYEVTGTDIFYIDASLLSKEAVIYRADSVDTTTSLEIASNVQQISIYPIGREQTNIQVSGATTFLYDLSGQLINKSNEVVLTANFYPPGFITPLTNEIEWTWICPSNSMIENFKPNKNTVSFTIANSLDREKTNNGIIVSTIYNNINYSSVVSLGFIQEGDMGTSGTGISCRIGVANFIEGKPGAIEYPMFLSTSLQTLSFNQTDLILSSGATKWQLSYELVNATTGVILTPDSNKTKWYLWNREHDINVITAGRDILCVELWVDDNCFYGFLPIAFQTAQTIGLHEGSGFVNVTYEPSGQMPSYFKSPFKLTTGLQGYWFGSDTKVQNLNCKVSFNNNFSECYITPPERFSILDKNVTDIYVDFSLKNNTEEEKVLLPLLFQYNPYGNAVINGWDGQKVQISESEVLGPMAGFGVKNEDNTFSGVLLGEINSTNGDNFSSRKGIIGRHQSKETFFLNANDGSASFGTVGEGQIKFIPGKESIINGGNFERYFKGDIISEGVFLTLNPEVRSNFSLLENGTYQCEMECTTNAGMSINLSKPTLEWGNGNFKIDQNGNLFAQNATIQGNISANGGHIGDWILDKTQFYTTSSKMADGQTIHEERKTFQSKEIKVFNRSIQSGWTFSRPSYPFEALLKINTTENNSMVKASISASNINFYPPSLDDMDPDYNESLPSYYKYTVYPPYSHVIGYRFTGTDGQEYEGSFFPGGYSDGFYLDFQETNYDYYHIFYDNDEFIASSKTVNFDYYIHNDQFRPVLEYQASMATLIQDPTDSYFWLLQPGDSESQAYSGKTFYYRVQWGGDDTFEPFTFSPRISKFDLQKISESGIYLRIESSVKSTYYPWAELEFDSAENKWKINPSAVYNVSLDIIEENVWSSVSTNPVGNVSVNRNVVSCFYPIYLTMIYRHYPNKFTLFDDNIKIALQINSVGNITCTVNTLVACTGSCDIIFGNKKISFSEGTQTFAYAGLTINNNGNYTIPVNNKVVKLNTDNNYLRILGDSAYQTIELIFFEKNRTAIFETDPFVGWQTIEGTLTGFRIEAPNPLDIMEVSVDISQNLIEPTAEIIGYNYFAIDGIKNEIIPNTQFIWSIESQDLTNLSTFSVTAGMKISLTSHLNLTQNANNIKSIFENFDSLKNLKVKFVGSNGPANSIKTTATLTTLLWRFMFDGDQNNPKINILQNGKTAFSIGSLGNRFAGQCFLEADSTLSDHIITSAEGITSLGYSSSSGKNEVASTFFGTLKELGNTGYTGIPTTDRKIVLGIGGEMANIKKEVNKNILMSYGESITLPGVVKQNSVELNSTTADIYGAYNTTTHYNHGSYTWPSQEVNVETAASWNEMDKYMSVASIIIYYPQTYEEGESRMNYTLNTTGEAIVYRIQQKLRALCMYSSLSFKNFSFDATKGIEKIEIDDIDSNDRPDFKAAKQGFYIVHLNAFNKIYGVAEEDRRVFATLFKENFSFTRSGGREKINWTYDSTSQKLSIGRLIGWAPPLGYTPLSFNYIAETVQENFNYKLIITSKGNIYQLRDDNTYKAIT